MEKRDRAQKMKRDKRNKDAKRGRDNSSKTAASKPQESSAKDEKGDVKPVLNKTTVEEAKEVVQIDFTNLKRETDEINQLNKTYSKRQVTSNWSKYETPLPPADDEVISKGADFESLLGAPISEGGHFKFKSEQMWSQNPLQFSDIFSLDVKHLARTLSCVPFYEQVSLSKELFSKEELEIMDKEAAQNSDRFKNTLEEPVLNNFYEVLKSSLADTPVQKITETKLDINNDSVVTEPTENTRVITSFVDNQFDNVQPLQSMQLEKGSDITPDSQEIVLKPKNEENVSIVSKDNVNIVAPQVTLGQTSIESKINNSIDKEIMPKEEEISVKKNDTSNKVEVGLPATSVSNEPSPQSNDSTLKQDPIPVEEDDELDFLLQLKHPVSGPKFVANVPSKPVAADDILSDDLGALSLSHTETKEDLEDWLDSMLAD